jgi:hypothetical protein
MTRRFNAAVKASPAPTFEERFAALVEELFDIPAEEQVKALKALDEALDHAVDLIAEERRPKGALALDALGQPAIVGAIPAKAIRQDLDARGRGNLEVYIAAIKER